MSLTNYLSEINNIDKREDNIYRLFDMETEIAQEELRTILDYYENPDETITFQRWTLIPKRLLIKTWEDFMKYGFVKNEKSVDKMLDIIMHNVAKLRVNNKLTGHDQYFVDEHVLDFVGLDEKMSWHEFEETYGHITEEYLYDPVQRQYAISDYGLPAIEKVLGKILGEDDYNKILVGIDMILNIIHPRSDLASYFVEGGSDTLSELSRKDEDED
jgi:hypothetical protein